MKYFLGMNLVGHDTAFYLIDESANMIFGIEEEKIIKSRYYTTYSYFALDYALEREGINKKDIAAIGQAFSFQEYKKLFKRHERLYGEVMARRHAAVIKRQFEYRQNLINSMGFSNVESVEVPHHLCHAMSAFSLSPFKSAAVIAIDGSGENETTVIYHATGKDMIKKAAVLRPNSLGWIWEFVTTDWLRFGVVGNEGKTMGLAAYGKPIYKDKFYEGFDTRLGKLPIFKVDWNTGLFESPAARELYGRNIKIDEILGESPPYTSIPGEYQRDIAATLQEVTNEIFLALAGHAKRVTGEGNLVLCGGVAMNSVANGVVERSGIFKNVFIPPSASDNGVGLGSALYAYNQLLGKKQYKVKSTLPYTSCSYGEHEIIDALEKFNLPISKPADIVKETASELIKGSIVGWHQDKMELGARALGNRSILTLPYPAAMKDKVNSRVKFRECWRPFAPVIKEELFNEWFDSSATSQLYMTSTQPFKKGMGERVPAVLHEDGTGRVQTCSAEKNPKLYRLLTEIEKLTTIPILLNTSFNIKGMPIVCSPEDAVLCYLCTDIDVLVIGDYIVRKSDHPANRVSFLKVSHANRLLDMTLQNNDKPLFITDGSDAENEKLSKLLNETLNKKHLVGNVRGCYDNMDDTADFTKIYILINADDIFNSSFIKTVKPKIEQVYALTAEKGINCYILNLSGSSFVLNQLLSRKNLESIINDTQALK